MKAGTMSEKSSRCADGAAYHDAVMDGYLTWREESAAVGTSYRIWTVAVRPQRDSAFAAYEAALEREELAASAYRCLVEQAAAA